MAVRRLYEPLCIAFGTTVSSPTVPTYQLYDLPHKFTPRLYMESEDPNLVLREIGVWAGWEQAGSADTRSFLLDLLKDKDAHDNFLLREAGPTRFRRVRGIIVLTQKHLRIVQTKGSRLGSACPKNDGARDRRCCLRERKEKTGEPAPLKTPSPPRLHLAPGRTFTTTRGTGPSATGKSPPGTSLRLPALNGLHLLSLAWPQRPACRQLRLCAANTIFPPNPN